MKPGGYRIVTMGDATDGTALASPDAPACVVDPQIFAMAKGFGVGVLVGALGATVVMFYAKSKRWI